MLPAHGPERADFGPHGGCKPLPLLGVSEKPVYLRMPDGRAGIVLGRRLGSRQKGRAVAGAGRA